MRFTTLLVVSVLISFSAAGDTWYVPDLNKCFNDSGLVFDYSEGVWKCDIAEIPVEATSDRTFVAPDTPCKDDEVLLFDAAIDDWKCAQVEFGDLSVPDYDCDNCVISEDVTAVEYLEKDEIISALKTAKKALESVMSESCKERSSGLEKINKLLEKIY